MIRWFITIGLIITSFEISAQKGNLHVCFFDANESISPQIPTTDLKKNFGNPSQLQFILPFLLNEKEFLKKENDNISTKYGRWIDSCYKYKSLSDNDYKKLKGLKIHIANVNNCMGMAYNDSIVIDKGLVFTIMNFSVSEALLQAGIIDTSIYNHWHDYFINAMIKKDPVTFCTGLTFFDTGFGHLLDSNETVKSFYYQTSNAWQAYILLHEAAHILLQHAAIWQKKYPAFNDSNLDKWSKDALMYSQKQELEADNLFIELYTKILKYDISPLFANCADWFIIREGCYAYNGVKLYETHPSASTRFKNLLDKYCENAKLPKANCDNTFSMFNDYYQRLLEKVKNADTREVPKLEGKRPQGVDIHFERFFVRDAQLQILFERDTKTIRH